MNIELLSQVRRFGDDFHEVTIENVCQIPWRVTKWHSRQHIIIVFRLLISPFSPRNVFLLDIVASPQLNLWRHANARNCHCDAIFVDCSCTRELSHGLSSLMNNNREYWFPATHYSRPRVCVRNWYLACARNGYITIWWYTTGITSVQCAVCENQIRICWETLQMKSHNWWNAKLMG